MIKDVIKKVNFYFIESIKQAASPEFFALQKDKRFKYWFGENYAFTNNDSNFSYLDKQNIKAINELNNYSGFTDDVAEFYRNHPKTQEFITYVCKTFNQKFKNLNSLKVLDNIEMDAIDNPTFMLIHDLIHNVMQHDFVESLKNQKERDDNSLGPILLDELMEDIASAMSNFTPSKPGQGLINYLSSLLSFNLKNKNIDSETVEEAIERTFHQAKAELRGKIDKIKTDDDRFVKSKIPNQIKNMVDGILSKLKKTMIDQVDDIDFYKAKNNQVFDMFHINDIVDVYFEKIKSSYLINSTDASALRSWMMDIMQKAKILNNYFTNDLEKEMFGDNDEDIEE